jgi:hypothetical protein
MGNVSDFREKVPLSLREMFRQINERVCAVYHAVDPVRSTIHMRIEFHVKQRLLCFQNPKGHIDV